MNNENTTPPVLSPDEIYCPFCSVAVQQMASSTLSLALWQHVAWACPQWKELDAQRTRLAKAEQEIVALKRIVEIYENQLEKLEKK
jgi:hypothetical protein